MLDERQIAELIGPAAYRPASWASGNGQAKGGEPAKIDGQSKSDEPAKGDGEAKIEEPAKSAEAAKSESKSDGETKNAGA